MLVSQSKSKQSQQISFCVQSKLKRLGGLSGSGKSSEHGRQVYLMTHGRIELATRHNSVVIGIDQLNAFMGAPYCG